MVKGCTNSLSSQHASSDINLKIIFSVKLSLIIIVLFLLLNFTKRSIHNFFLSEMYFQGDNKTLAKSYLLCKYIFY